MEPIGSPRAGRVRRCDKYWLVIVVARDRETFETIRTEMNEKGVFPSSECEVYDSLEKAIAACKRGRNTSYMVYMDLEGWEQDRTVKSALKKVNKLGFRRCVLHCWNTRALPNPSGVSLDRLIDFAGCGREGHAYNRHLIDLMARIGFRGTSPTESILASDGEDNDEQSDDTSSSDESFDEDELLTEEDPTTVPHDPSNGNGSSNEVEPKRQKRCIVDPSQLRLRVIQVINNLPSHERIAHWNISLGRFLREGVYNIDQTVILVYRTRLHEYAECKRLPASLVTEKFEKFYCQRRSDNPWIPNALITYEEPVAEHDPDRTMYDGFRLDAEAVGDCLKRELQVQGQNGINIHIKPVLSPDTLRSVLALPLSRRDSNMIWYHAGHNSPTQLLNADLHTFFHNMVEDHFQLAFFNACFGLGIAMHLKNRIDNIIFWDGPVNTHVCRVVAEKFFKRFAELWRDRESSAVCRTLRACVKQAFDDLGNIIEVNNKRYFIKEEVAGCEKAGGMLCLLQSGHDLAPLEQLKITFANGKSIVLNTSPMKEVSLNGASKERAMIPNKARYYLYVHCCDVADFEGLFKDLDVDLSEGQRTNEDERKLLVRLLQVGGFVYFDKNENVVAINAIGYDGKGVPDAHNELEGFEHGVLTTNSFHSAPPRLAMRASVFCRLRPQLASGAHPLTRDPQNPKEKFVVSMTWLTPDEKVNDHIQTFPNGAFIIMRFKFSAPDMIEAYSLAVRRSA